MDLLTILISITIVLISWYLFNRRACKGRKFPGPKGNLIFGHTFQMNFEKLHLQLFQWSKTYGEIFEIKLFGKVFVIVNSSRALRELFSKEPNATLTSSRPETFAKSYMLSDADVVNCSLDEDCIKRRKLMHRLLHAYGEGLQYIEGQINARLSELRKELWKFSGEACDPQDMLNDFVLSIVEILLVGKSFERDSDFHKYLIELTNVGNEAANPGVDIVYYHLPILRFLPLSTTKAYKKFIKLRDELLDFLEEKSNNCDIGVYPLMRKLMQGKECGLERTPWLSETVMESLLLNFMGGTYLTTRSALLSIVRILMTQPEVQTKLQEVVDRVVGHDRPPSLSDRPHMPYFEAFILETLRYISHLPAAFLHSTSDDVTYGEYTIPKNAVILPNLWAMHHSDNEWDKPFQFVPERFLDKNGDILPANHESRKRFMAFGHGKRACLGEVFARSRIFLFLSTLTQVCTVLPPDGITPPMMDPRDMSPGIALQPYPFTCRFVMRTI